MYLAVFIFTFLMAVLTIFQVCLALGLPIGQFAWGGQHKVLPNKLRIASVFSIIIYLVFVITILSRSEIYELISRGGFVDIFTWVIVAYLSIGVIMNLLSKSLAEKATMTPVAFILALCALIVALN